MTEWVPEDDVERPAGGFGERHGDLGADAAPADAEDLATDVEGASVDDHRRSHDDRGDEVAREAPPW